MKVMAIGDSLSRGVNEYDKIYQSYGEIVAAELRADFVNFSVPGYKLPNLLKDLKKDINHKQIIKKLKFQKYEYFNDYLVEGSIIENIQSSDIILITIGGNDSKVLNDLSKINQTKLLFDITNNLKKVFKIIRKENPNAKIFYFSIYNAFNREEKVNKDIKKYINKYMKVASFNMKEIKFIDIVDAVSQNNFRPNDNNVHLNDLGYKYMAKEILNKI